MASSSDSIFGLTTSILTIPVGATVSTLVVAGRTTRSMLLKYASGGSLSIFGCPQTIPPGTTSVGTSIGTLGITALVAGYSNSYLLGATETFAVGGPALFYVSATGSTAFAYIVQNCSADIPSFNSPG